MRERSGGVPQPWTIEKKPDKNTITLRFTVNSDIDYEGAELALEDADKAKITFNGESVKNDILGNFVDIEIFRVKLPKINKGVNTLEITIPFGPRTNTENVFILGDFGVECKGRNAKIIEKPEKIMFGSLLNQGFPFYGGNVTYKFKAETATGDLYICASDYRGATMSAKIDGKDAGKIIYPPYIVSEKGLSKGEHDVELKLFTHRYNTFGPLHLVNTRESWHGPGAWRSTGMNWSYEYVLREAGILATPRISDGE